MAISSFGFGGSNVHAIIAGCVRPKGPPPRALPAPEPAQASEDIENGGPSSRRFRRASLNRSPCCSLQRQAAAVFYEYIKQYNYGE